MLWWVELCHGSPHACVCGFLRVGVATFFSALCEGGKVTAMPHKCQFSPCLFLFCYFFPCCGKLTENIFFFLSQLPHCAVMVTDEAN